MNKEKISEYFKVIERAAHTNNWRDDIERAESVFMADEENYVVLFPFMYAILEDVIRSMTTDYGMLIPDAVSKKKTGKGLLDMAIDQSQDSQQKVLLEDMRHNHYERFSSEEGSANRNNVLHGVVPPLFWKKEDFEDLLKDIAELTKYMSI